MQLLQFTFFRTIYLTSKTMSYYQSFRFLAIHQLRNTMNVKGVAQSLSISSSTVFRRLKDLNFAKPNALPLVLSIDEFKGNAGGQKFQAILTDPKSHKVIDILPSRTQYQLQEYIKSFSNRKDVRYFVMDMNRYIETLQKLSCLTQPS